MVCGFQARKPSSNYKAKEVQIQYSQLHFRSIGKDEKNSAPIFSPLLFKILSLQRFPAHISQNLGTIFVELLPDLLMLLYQNLLYSFSMFNEGTN